MRRVLTYGFLALATLGTTAAGAQTQTTSYVLVPTITPGVTKTRVEMLRTNNALVNVGATYVGDGQSGLAIPPTNVKAYVGPSTSQPNPLLDLSPIVPTGGMVVLDPVPGLSPVEVSFEVEQSPIRTAWKLPLLTADQFFPVHGIAYVLNLQKASDAVSTLQIFNVGTTAAGCALQVLRPKGTVIEQRVGITVPAVGVIAIDNILRKVAAAEAGGINVAVSCDQPFYALASFPATNRWESRVEFPVSELPSTTPTTVVLENNPGAFFHVTQSDSDLLIPLALDPDTNYHTMAINFDVTVADPNEFVVFRNVIGMFRHGGRRFGKTLYFGSFENFDKQKYVEDVGTPFIETTLKRNFPLLGGHTYHFAITLDNDQQSLHYVITNAGGTQIVTDMLGGLYNNFNVVGGEAPIIEIGLASVADNAYFPPIGWRFSNFNVSATK